MDFKNSAFITWLNLFKNNPSGFIFSIDSRLQKSWLRNIFFTFCVRYKTWHTYTTHHERYVLLSLFMNSNYFCKKKSLKVEILNKKKNLKTFLPNAYFHCINVAHMPVFFTIMLVFNIFWFSFKVFPFFSLFPYIIFLIRFLKETCRRVIFFFPYIVVFGT